VFPHRLNIDELREQIGGELVKQKGRKHGDYSGEGSYGVVTSFGNQKISKLLMTSKILAKKHVSSVILGSILHENATLYAMTDVPNIINTDELYLKNIVMDEYYEDLERMLAHNKFPRTFEQLKHIFFKILDGVNSMHRRRIYHQDLKPANVMIGRQVDEDHVEMDDIAIIDFGLTYFGPRKEITRYTYPIGTPAFRPPEVELMLYRANTYDYEKIDVWSLGMIGLTIFSKNPFLAYKLYKNESQQSLYETLYDIESDVYKHLPKKFEKIPNMRPIEIEKYAPILNYEPELKDLLEGMLNLSPVKRYTMKRIFKSKYFEDAKYKTTFPPNITHRRSIINTLEPSQYGTPDTELVLYPVANISDDLRVKLAYATISFVVCVKRFFLSWNVIIHTAHILIDTMNRIPNISDIKPYVIASILIACNLFSSSCTEISMRDAIDVLKSSEKLNPTDKKYSQQHYEDVIVKTLIEISDFNDYDFYNSTTYELLDLKEHSIRTINEISFMYLVHLCLPYETKLNDFEEIARKGPQWDKISNDRITKYLKKAYKILGRM